MSQRPAELRRLVRSGRALVAIPIAWIVAVSVIDVLAPPDIHLGPLLLAAPVITPLFGGPWTVCLVAALTAMAETIIGLLHDSEGMLSANHEAQIIGQILVGASSVIFCVLRERRAKELAQVRYVSDTAQRLVLPPLPKQLGPLHVTSLYLAAEAEARIGGDLYAAARTTSGTRLMAGEVRGKGMTAVDDAALLLGAFCVAAHCQASLGELVAYLDRRVCWDLIEPGETSCYGETFITATPRQAAPRERPGLLLGGGRRLPHPGVGGGTKTGRNPVDRGRTGSKHHLITDATGVPLAATLTGGNRNDGAQRIPLLQAVPPVRGKRGRPGAAPT